MFKHLFKTRLAQENQRLREQNGALRDQIATARAVNVAHARDNLVYVRELRLINRAMQRRNRQVKRLRFELTGTRAAIRLLNSELLRYRPAEPVQHRADPEPGQREFLGREHAS